VTADEAMALARHEIACIPDAERRQAFGALLAPAQNEMRLKKCGPEIFECWQVARVAERRISIVYVCWEYEEHWAVVPDEQPDLCYDGHWFLLLDDALISCAWNGPLPPNYEVS